MGKCDIFCDSIAFYICQKLPDAYNKSFMTTKTFNIKDLLKCSFLAMRQITFLFHWRIVFPKEQGIT